MRSQFMVLFPQCWFTFGVERRSTLRSAATVHRCIERGPGARDSAVSGTDNRKSYRANLFASVCQHTEPADDSTRQSRLRKPGLAFSCSGSPEPEKTEWTNRN